MPSFLSGVSALGARMAATNPASFVVTTTRAVAIEVASWSYTSTATSGNRRLVVQLWETDPSDVLLFEGDSGKNQGADQVRYYQAGLVPSTRDAADPLIVFPTGKLLLWPTAELRVLDKNNVDANDEILGQVLGLPLLEEPALTISGGMLRLGGDPSGA